MTDFEFAVESARRGVIESRRKNAPPVEDGAKPQSCEHLISPERWFLRGLVDSLLGGGFFGLLWVVYWFGYVYSYGPDRAALFHEQIALWLGLTLAGTLAVNWICRVPSAEKTQKRVEQIFERTEPPFLAFKLRWKMRLLFWRQTHFRYWLYVYIGAAGAWAFFHTVFHNPGFLDGPWCLPVIWSSIAAFVAGASHMEEVVVRPPVVEKNQPFGDDSQASVDALDKAGL